MSTRYTYRELEVVGYLARWLSNNEIATVLGMRLPTVKTHIRHFTQKADLPRKNRVNATLAYLRLCDDVERDRIIGDARIRSLIPRAVSVVRRPAPLSEPAAEAAE